MRININFCLLPILTLTSLNAQIGINVKNPNPNTDIHLGSKNKTILLNHVYDVIEIDQPEDGMLIYDEKEECFKGFANNEWTDCFGSQILENPVPVLEANGPGFNSMYQAGQNLSNATFTVTFTNNSFSTAKFKLNISDLELSDPTIIVAGVTPSEITLNAGQVGTAVYKLTGTPKKIGKLIGYWKKLSLAYEGNTYVNKGCLPGSWNNTILPPVDFGFSSNTAYTGTYTIPYSGGENTYFPAENYETNGLQLSYAGGQGEENGKLEYQLYGTYNGPDGGAINFTTNESCSIAAGSFPRNCKEILASNPDATSGVYKIDPDGSSTKYSSFDAYCDMETDGGGWTLILIITIKEEPIQI